MKVNYLKQRHIGLSAQDEQTMLKVIGAESVDQLISETMPEDILLKEPIVLSDPLSEQEMLDLLSALQRRMRRTAVTSVAAGTERLHPR